MKAVNIYDYLVVAGYFAFMLGIGLYFIRINKSGREYFVGGNMIPWWVSGMTLYMANFSAWTFSGAAGFTYATGPFMLLWFSTGAFAYALGSLMTAKRWRRTRSISPVEYTYTRFNVTTQQFLGWVISLNFTLSAGVQLAATAKLLAPVLGMDITVVTLITGTVILLYTFLGGVWAVSVTDVVQGVILVCTTLVIVPLSIGFAGGLGEFIAKLPPLTFDHMYNGVHYTEHWLISILLISTIGFAAGSGQRFYSVKDERSALKVGMFAACLALAGPIMFGIPPLVAREMWPDLSRLTFFRPFLDNNPQDLVYLALCLKFLPNGLIGVFIAAMLAATMSTLSAVYNMVSSIVARDMVQGLFRPKTRDDELLKIGRIASGGIGLLVIVLAVVFVTSKFGIFNIMQTFFTLFNIPVTVPLAFGLIFRRVPKWSAVSGITWGLLAGIASRYLLGWDIGPQVYLAFAMTFGIFVASPWIGRLYRRNRLALALLACVLSAGIGILFMKTGTGVSVAYVDSLSWACAAGFGISMLVFARLFTVDTEEELRAVSAFFAKLLTPVDVQKEVFGAGKKQISTMPLVGGTMILMGILLSLVFLTGVPAGEQVVLGVMIGLMIVLGAAFWYFGKKSEIRGSVVEG